MTETTKPKTPRKLTEAAASKKLDQRITSLEKAVDEALAAGHALPTLKAMRALSKLSTVKTYEATAIATKNKVGSWSSIGEALGVSKQTAHARFKLMEKRFNAGEAALKEVASEKFDLVKDKVQAMRDRDRAADEIEVEVKDAGVDKDQQN